MFHERYRYLYHSKSGVIKASFVSDILHHHSGAEATELMIYFRNAVIK
jgi:hypothetical protein